MLQVNMLFCFTVLFSVFMSVSSAFSIDLETFLTQMETQCQTAFGTEVSAHEISSASLEMLTDDELNRLLPYSRKEMQELCQSQLWSWQTVHDGELMLVFLACSQYRDLQLQFVTNVLSLSLPHITEYALCYYAADQDVYLSWCAEIGQRLTTNRNSPYGSRVVIGAITASSAGDNEHYKEQIFWTFLLGKVIDSVELDSVRTSKHATSVLFYQLIWNNDFLSFELFQHLKEILKPQTIRTYLDTLKSRTDDQSLKRIADLGFHLYYEISRFAYLRNFGPDNDESERDLRAEIFFQWAEVMDLGPSQLLSASHSLQPESRRTK